MQIIPTKYYKYIYFGDYIRLILVTLCNGLANLSFGIFINTLLSSFKSLYDNTSLSPHVKTVLGMFTNNISASTILNAIIIIWISSRILRFISKNILIYTNVKIFSRINNMTAAFINQIPFNTYLSTSSGYIKEQIFNLDKEFGKNIHTVFEHLIPEIVFIIISFIKLYFYSPVFTGIVFIWSIVNMIIIVIFSRFMKQFVKNMVKTNSNRSSFYIEMCNVFLLTKFFKLGDILTNIANDNYNDVYIKAGRKFWRFNSIMLLVSGIVTWFIVAVIGYKILFAELCSGRITLGGFQDIFLTMLWLSSHVFQASENIANILSSLETIKIGLKFIENNTSLPDNPNARVLDTNIQNIECKNVELSYKTENGPVEIFNNLNINIKSGDIITILGPSGCGKSSLFNIISGVISPTQGSVVINNIDMQNLNKSNIIDKCVYITQSHTLIDNTIAYNIKLGDMNASDEKVASLIKQLKLPSGDMIVGQGGVKLSGGQRQRVCIARALLKYNPGDLILCDEITSSLDSASSKYVVDLLVNLAKNNNSILIFIDHSNLTVKYSNKLVFFSVDEYNNKTILFDTHNNLLENSQYYRDMF